MNKKQREAHISKACKDYGCDKETGQRHRNAYVKFGWDPHPPTEFLAWWNPTGKDEASGAHIGGQPDAVRIWARKDEGGWARGSHGITSEVAWNTKHFRDKYEAWAQAGSPEPDEPFISIALTRDEQQRRWQALRQILGKIGKPMPKPEPFDYDRNGVGPIDF
jgi:hypothetical protein